MKGSHGGLMVRVRLRVNTSIPSRVGKVNTRGWDCNKPLPPRVDVEGRRALVLDRVKRVPVVDSRLRKVSALARSVMTGG